MKRFTTVLVTTLLLTLSACDDDSGSKPEGSEGAQCYPDGTCDTDLTCQEGTCINPRINNKNPGEFWGDCLEGGICNEGLICYNNKCDNDHDGDGYAEQIDCDDNDETVYPGTIHECTSECAYGTKSCNSEGEWTPCTADPAECACSQAGDTKQVSCGKCGTATIMCTADLVWSFPEECVGEGDCHPWETQEGECGNCGTRERSCTAECLWEEWPACENEGVCTPGVTEWTTDDCTPQGTLQQRECDATCNWNQVVACFSECQVAPRAGGVTPTGDPDFKDEVCIPSGEFIFGNDSDSYEPPEFNIFLSPYFIDKYEVTVYRYKECVDAGVCTEPDYTTTDWDAPENFNLPINRVTHDQAVVFCNWDGGRALPTEAQWEKAAKGPYPEQKIWPWGDSPEISCEDYVNLSGCPDYDSQNPRLPVDSYPLAASYYYVFNMLANVTEHCRDKYTDDPLNDFERFDPYFSAGSDLGYSTRGRSYGDSILEERMNLNYRAHVAMSYVSNRIGFRCARRAY